MNEELQIEVAYAQPHQQVVIALTVPAGTGVREAIERSGILARFPEIDLEKNKMGIFGKLAKADTVLHDQDRLEIYRPLLADPKDVRRSRAAAAKAATTGGAPQSRRS
jgi:uncharacterized protein